MTLTFCLVILAVHRGEAVVLDHAKAVRDMVFRLVAELDHFDH